jgi:YD repeat-containing protein
MLKKTYVRDGRNRLIGSVTTGFRGSFEALVRDEQGNIMGRTSERFGTTRDAQGNLISLNTADPGLLINRGKK